MTKIEKAALSAARKEKDPALRAKRVADVEAAIRCGLYRSKKG